MISGFTNSKLRLVLTERSSHDSKSSRQGQSQGDPGVWRDLSGAKDHFAVLVVVDVLAPCAPARPYRVDAKSIYKPHLPQSLRVDASD